jgi:hypothetical protein
MCFQMCVACMHGMCSLRHVTSLRTGLGLRARYARPPCSAADRDEWLPHLIAALSTGFTAHLPSVGAVRRTESWPALLVIGACSQANLSPLDHAARAAVRQVWCNLGGHMTIQSHTWCIGFYSPTHPSTRVRTGSERARPVLRSHGGRQFSSVPKKPVGDPSH